MGAGVIGDDVHNKALKERQLNVQIRCLFIIVRFAVKIIAIIIYLFSFAAFGQPTLFRGCCHRAAAATESTRESDKVTDRIDCRWMGIVLRLFEKTNRWIGRLSLAALLSLSKS